MKELDKNLGNYMKTSTMTKPDQVSLNCISKNIKTVNKIKDKINLPDKPLQDKKVVDSKKLVINL